MPIAMQFLSSLVELDIDILNIPLTSHLDGLSTQRSVHLKIGSRRFQIFFWGTHFINYLFVIFLDSSIDTETKTMLL